MKRLLLVLLLLLSFKTFAIQGEWAGNINFESRYFLNEGAYSNSDQSHLSLGLDPEYSLSWDNGRKVITINPFFRVADPDEDRSHGDMREFSFVGAWENIELRLGYSKVYWGVTESAHLVDVINQTDMVENVDGEDKLGQLLISPSIISETYGTLTFFVLPEFRDRTFSGKNGRFRGTYIVDVGNAQYESSKKRWHPDWATRWSHYFGDLEVGLTYFQGTDREPQFSFDAGVNQLTPTYVQTKQASIDTQYIYQDWLFKLESIYKNSHFVDEYQATAYGFEYTFSNIWGGMDVGLLAEHIYDDRLTSSTGAFYDHVFVGSRLAVNDTLGTEVLAGGFHNNDNGLLEGFRLEATRRITNQLKWELEANFTFDPPPTSVLNSIKKDDFVQLQLSYYF